MALMVRALATWVGGVCHACKLTLALFPALSTVEIEYAAPDTSLAAYRGTVYREIASDMPRHTRSSMGMGMASFLIPRAAPSGETYAELRK